jgi:replicative DNA helicase
VYEDVKGVIRQLQEIVEDRESHEKRLSDLTGFKDQYFCDKSTNGVKFGIHGLDDMTGYLEGGDVIVIGARPSVGKSAFVIQVTNNMAKEGKKIAFYNLEMTEKQIYERYVSHISGIELTRLRRAIAYTDNEQELFDRANETIAKNYSNLTVITGSKSISEIRAECINKDYDIIIIDYLQLIIPDSSYRGNRFAEVGKISRDLKNLATELKIPIVALSQLNRVSESTETKEPTMGELRESGNVEQDASIIILMWNLNEERTLKGIKVDKNRQGKTGKIELKFDGSRMKFIEEEWEDSTDYPFT